MIFGIAYWRRLLNSSKQDPKRKATAKKEKTEKADSNQERKELARDELVGKSKPFISSSFPTVPKSSSSEKADDNPATFAELDSCLLYTSLRRYRCGLVITVDGHRLPLL